MRKAIAIAAVRPHPLKEAFMAVEHSLQKMSDALYGTKERTEMTYVWSFAMLFIGSAMMVSAQHAAHYMICTN